MLEWFRSIDWEVVGGLALVLVLGGLLMYGLDRVRYDMKFPSRRHKRQRKGLENGGEMERGGQL